jgi:FkbM family methyltransferase
MRSKRGRKTLLEKLIYDVGMNDGNDTAYYLHRGFSVVAIEADPVLAEQASLRFPREIAEGRLKIMNVAISENAGVLPFWICETKSGWNSFDRSIASRDGCPHHQIEVQCSRLDSILANEGVPYYLKIDIEGHDSLCLDQLVDHDLPKYISLESGGVEPLYRLQKLGYTHFKCISQFYFFPLDLPPIPQEVKYRHLANLMTDRNILLRVARRCGAWRPILARMTRIRHEMEKNRTSNGWTFSGETSGPFGEDTSGRWQSFDEIIRTYEYYHDLAKERKPSLFWTDAEYSFWMDFHARRDG